MLKKLLFKKTSELRGDYFNKKIDCNIDIKKSKQTFFNSFFTL